MTTLIRPVKSAMFWMWMMAGMIALELNSVTRIHNEISFSDGEMPATHHNPEFCFSSY